MLAAKVVGAPIGIVRDHAAWSSITPWSTRLSALVFPLQAIQALLMVVAVFVRRGMRDGVRYSGAAILAFIITGKVFSPQYLIWLVPFIAAVEPPVAPCGFLRIFATGMRVTLLAPGLTGSFPRDSLWVILAYNAKNGLFVWLLGVLVFGPRSGDDAGPRDRQISRSAPTG